MKVTVVGAGHVGATCAQRLVESRLCDVYLVDVVEGLAKGTALDIMQAAPVLRHSCRIAGGESYDGAEGSQVVVITAGIPRKPGMSRDDLLHTNGDIVTDVAQNLKQHCPGAIVVMVSNPLDVTTHIVSEILEQPRQRVMGMAGILDTARFCTFIAMELGVSAADVTAMVLGGHGDTMVPLPRHASVSGVPVTELIAPDRLAQIVARTTDGGAEIVSYLKTGSAFYAPSAAVVQMVRAILRDEKRVLPCSVMLQGEYGLNNVFVGVPTVLGAAGAEQVLELDLTDGELNALRASAAAVQATVGEWERLRVSS
ncbi:MAG: malate dehydrogenase [Bacteroidota bacterium]